MTRARLRPRPVLLGHRGARSLKSIPENTLASFDRALADGCDGFEFDLRRTADGEAVICHDAESCGIEIARARARQLPALPRLAMVLARYPEKFLDLELKVAGLESTVVEQVRERAAETYVVSSFLPEVLKTIHAADAKILLGLICETKDQLRGWNQMAIRYVIPHHRLVDKALIHEAHGTGKKILVWTVNTAEEMKRLAEWGVDGIISDRTRLLCRTLRA